MMKTSMILALVLLALQSHAAVPPVGTWEWSNTEEAAGIVTTPQDAGFTLTRVFQDDFTYLELRDGELFRVGTYWVEDVVYQYAIIPALRIQVEGEPLDAPAYYCDGTRLALIRGNDEGGFPSYPIENLLPASVVPASTSAWGAVKVLFR